MKKHTTKYLTYCTLALNTFNSTQASTSFLVKLKEGCQASPSFYSSMVEIKEAQVEISSSPNKLNLYTIDFSVDLDGPESDKFLSHLKSNDSVEYAEENTLYYIDNERDVKLKEKIFFSNKLSFFRKKYLQISSLSIFSSSYELKPQWSYDVINAFFAREITLGKPDICIALLDTGIDTCHKNLNHINGKTLQGVNFIKENSSCFIQDLDGHGTHCAGIITGSNGIAPCCKLMPIKVTDSYSKQKKIDIINALIKGIVYAADNGANVIVINHSFRENSSCMEEAVIYAQKRGCLLIASAGDNNTDMKYYPAAFNGVLSVGAINHNYEKLKQSNYGDWVLVCAPGKDIQSTWLKNSTKAISGTSMANSYVAGLAGLLFSLGGDTITAEEVKKIIELTCNSSKGILSCKYGLIDNQKALNYFLRSKI